ncbi:hypothetical protein ANCCAN_09295 [Ancylostoma caninum]|uniref:Uncharacterized protein n=1 Tax=Ancylostoma caninum TaxID=29170 RepID=A0A368GNS3_ANCCA|nr:hypothetical protein ANCCAN_09295 [Ancylostoma caninum]
MSSLRREEFQGNSWRRDGGPRHPDYDDWRRESSWRPRSPSPRGFAGPPRELIPGLAGPPRELIPGPAGPPREFIPGPAGPPRELLPGLRGAPRELIPPRRRSPGLNGRGRSPRNGGLSHRSEELLKREPAERERRSVRRSPSPRREEHLKNLSDEELEKAAILQMKLMAEQADDKDKLQRSPKRNKKKELDNKQTPKSTSQNNAERKIEVKEKTQRVNMPEVKVEEEDSSTLLTPKLEPLENFDKVRLPTKFHYRGE